MRVDWTKVFEAMKRGRRGTPREGDHELCVAAHAEDDIRYATLKEQANREVDAEVRRGG